MKFLVVLTISAFVAAAQSLPVLETTTASPQIVRNKRTLGVDKNIKKDLEIETKHGTKIKVSKTINYNDGGAVQFLPSLLDGITKNKIQLIEALRGRKSSQTVAEPVDNVENFDASANAENQARSHVLLVKYPIVVASPQQNINLEELFDDYKNLFVRYKHLLTGHYHVSPRHFNRLRETLALKHAILQQKLAYKMQEFASKKRFV